MTAITQLRPFNQPAFRPVVRFCAVVQQLWLGFEHVMEVWQQQRALETLDDRMLKDMGITRAQANYEANRSPWRVRQLFDE